MSTRDLSVWSFLLLSFFCFSQKGHGQFRQLPVSRAIPLNKESIANMRVTQDPMQLPFWDDFSSGLLAPDRWESRGAVVSNTIGLAAPTLGVVFLDGVDENGSAYAQNRLENGEGDELVSLPVDLSGLDPAEAASLYMSFYWQAGGKGEMPDENDALALYFLDSDDSWQEIWRQQGGEEFSSQSFEQVLLAVPLSFQHENFRFKFAHSGRLSGPFDTWILDYVFLNTGRSATDTFTEDRALTRLPGSPFSPYQAIPHFEYDPSQVSGTVDGEFKNLANRFRAMEYSILLRDAATGRLIDVPNQRTPFNPVPQAQERRSFSSNMPEDLDIMADQPFDLEVTTTLSAGDNFLVESISGQDTVYNENVDFRLNDSSSILIPFRDFYAYDNGTADYAAGINQRGGMLALEYEALSPAYITGLSINFTNASQRGNAIELMVWDSLGNEAMYQKEVVIPPDTALTSFSYFALDTNIRVEDTFYVGFTQFSNDYIHVGLEKSGNSGEKIFFNVLGSWEQNEEVSGNLMIRPHLSPNPPVEIPVDSDTGMLLYPNPVVDRLYLRAEVSEIEVYDFQGRQIKIPVEGEKSNKILNFTGSQKGMYLIKMIHKGHPVIKRIIVK
ncbi:Por secretion system C-terminal sorting domain-containing protein [Cyclobacterium lianum]|uniref:Por secretion system C-terminal sorting domain-containing protein n=1 Tax=Cyclobacterium lianum TaxID=388280 RepID=A0A1M7QTY8_9BACT|nr:T9SS type A sorting domain-containing protein [Cyclobacterium lianum]SHN34945.1 Por secretion system C-terminal sorting domain-containing protein [Cyclobacterium lianum]